MEALIGAYGRIVIPKPLRDALRLDAGTTAHLTATAGDSGGSEIVPCPEHDELVFASKGHVPLVYIGTPAGGTGTIDAVESVKAARRKRTTTLTDPEPQQS